MKTLDEVIKAFSEAIKEVGCGDCQFNDAESDDIPCEMTDCIFTDALHYLHEYREHRDQIDALPDYYDLVNFWAESQANPPLTWEELRDMEGKPIWVEWTKTEESYWCFVGEWFDDEEMRIYHMGRDDADYIHKTIYTPDIVQAYRKERK